MKKTKKYRFFIKNYILPLTTVVFAAILIIYMIYDVFREIGSGYVPSNVKPITFVVATFYISFSIWCYKKKLLLILFLLIIATLFYFDTYGWQYMELTGFDTYIEGLDCKNYNIHDVYSSIDFNESNKAIIYQEISLLANKSSTNYFTFTMPEGLIGYGLSMDGSYYNTSSRNFENKILFSHTNFTRPDRKYDTPNVTVYLNGSYKIKAFYYIENITPYGNFQFGYNDEGCSNNIDSIYYSVSFGDIVYECIQTCMIPYNPNATKNDFGIPFSYPNNTYVRPSISLAANEKNVNSIGFRLQTINKFFVMARLLSLSLISGLILTFIKLITDEPDYSIYRSSINRFAVSVRNMIGFVLTFIKSNIVRCYEYLQSIYKKIIQKPNSHKEIEAIKKQKINIFLKGTFHVGNKYRKDIENLTQKFQFDCFLSEGVSEKGEYNFKNFLKEPFFLIAIFVYFLFLKYFGRDISTLERVAKKKNIPLHNIDKNLGEIIKDGHKWYNYVLFLTLFAIILFVFFHLPVKLSLYDNLILTFVFSEIFYFSYFVLIKIFKTREDSWINKIIVIFTKKRYKNALMVCGMTHLSRIKKHLTAIGFIVKTV